MDTPEGWAQCHECGRRGVTDCPGPLACPALVHPPDLLEQIERCDDGVPAPEFAGPDQVNLFNLDSFTHESNAERIRRELEEAGLTPEARLKVYETTTIRQIVLLFQAPEYAQVLDDLAELMSESATESHTEAVCWLLQQWKSRIGAFSANA